ncbi:MAG: hypothetical protein WCA07_15145 [Gloeobacterales cyanobacterium]
MKTFYVLLSALLLLSTSPRAFAQEKAAPAKPTAAPASGVDALANELAQKFTPIRMPGFEINQVPFSYRFAAICNEKTKEILEDYFSTSFSRQGSVVLTKPEQLPSNFRNVSNCPKCRAEKESRSRIDNSFGDWLRRTATSFRDEVAAFCKTRK